MTPLPMIKFKGNVVIAAASVRRLCLIWINASTTCVLRPRNVVVPKSWAEVSSISTAEY